jgi:hypothetical protein
LTGGFATLLPLFFGWKELDVNGKRMFRLLAIVGLWCGACLAVRAAPWGELISLRSVEADANQAYPLTEANGPWMVMACSFSGDGAEKQAQQ